ncbi:methionyl-tRNA formyltransferase [Horticoccus sp. 23ND18S-11]|uniref:methionyl-tRNA formyltransferase n=1 Tax=Horticoccus sp. 23ND18S-11 TaxID=3391832 RepID=UPI0039C93C0D
MRIVFLGSDAIALPLLHWLAGPGAAVAQVVAVFTQPDRAVGRGQKVQPNAIKLWAIERGLPVLQPEKLDEVVRGQLAELGADLGLVMAYGHILRDDFIATPRLGMLNLHTSVLPKYRGASPIQTAIASGERATGVTLMRIVRRLDAGPVADVERVAIGNLDTALDIESRLGAACVAPVARALPRLAAGELEFISQDDAAATYCRKLQKEDGVLDFSVAASALAARVNGLYPWPGCAVEIGGQIVKLGLADVAAPGGAGVPPASGDESRRDADAPGGAPGEVIGADADGLLIATGQGVLRLRRLQRPGGRMLPAAEFLRGFPVAAGTRLPSHPMPVLVTTR